MRLPSSKGSVGMMYVLDTPVPTKNGIFIPSPLIVAGRRDTGLRESHPESASKRQEAPKEPIICRDGAGGVGFDARDRLAARVAAPIAGRGDGILF